MEPFSLVNILNQAKATPEFLQLLLRGTPTSGIEKRQFSLSPETIPSMAGQGLMSSIRGGATSNLASLLSPKKPFERKQVELSDEFRGETEERPPTDLLEKLGSLSLAPEAKAAEVTRPYEPPDMKGFPRTKYLGYGWSFDLPEGFDKFYVKKKRGEFEEINKDSYFTLMPRRVWAAVEDADYSSPYKYKETVDLGEVPQGANIKYLLLDKDNPKRPMFFEINGRRVEQVPEEMVSVGEFTAKYGGNLSIYFNDSASLVSIQGIPESPSIKPPLQPPGEQPLGEPGKHSFTISVGDLTDIRSPLDKTVVSKNRTLSGFPQGGAAEAEAKRINNLITDEYVKTHGREKSPGVWVLNVRF
jgi:hypothetical protein